MKMKTLVADRDDTIRAGIRSILDMQSDVSVIDDVKSRSDLMQKAKSLRYDLIIVEPVLDTAKGDLLIKSLREAAPGSNVLVFTILDELPHGVHAITSGAKGFLMKTCSVGEFLTAVRRVGRGNAHISSTLAEKCTQINTLNPKSMGFGTLTEREIDVYSMLVAGKKGTEIARLLKLSPTTVSTHKGRALSKLSCSTLSELVKHAIAHELVEKCRTHCGARETSGQVSHPTPSIAHHDIMPLLDEQSL